MNGTSKRFLIVDDSKSMVVLMTRILESEGHVVVGACDKVDDAVALYKSVNPDVVIMDLVLAGTNGINGIKKILEIDPNARVIAVSSTGGSPQKLIQALEAGAKQVMGKPFDAEKLLGVLKDLF